MTVPPEMLELVGPPGLLLLVGRLWWSVEGLRERVEHLELKAFAKKFTGTQARRENKRSVKMERSHKA